MNKIQAKIYISILLVFVLGMSFISSKAQATTVDRHIVCEIVGDAGYYIMEQRQHGVSLFYLYDSAMGEWLLEFLIIQAYEHYPIADSPELAYEMMDEFRVRSITFCYNLLASEAS